PVVFRASAAPRAAPAESPGGECGGGSARGAGGRPPARRPAAPPLRRPLLASPPDMNPRESVGIALDALRANKLRSSLTLLGVIIGVSSVIAVMSLVQGLDRYVSTRLAAAGSNVFSIDKVGVEFDFTRVREKLRRRDLAVEDAHAIARSATHVEAAVAERTAIATVRRGNRSLERVQVQGVESDYMRVDDLPVERGRPIAPADNRSRAWVCVI